MLVQLEERRVFNATFLLNAGGLTLSDFDANSNLNISQNGDNLEFQLSGAASNNWAPASGSNALSTSGGGSIITVGRADFTGSVNFTITDAPAGNLDVIIADTVRLPTATNGSTFAMTIGGQLDIARDTSPGGGDAFDATGYSLQFSAAGEILLHGDILDSAGDDAASVTLNSGDDVTLDGQISAEDSVTITSGGGIIDGNGNLVNIDAPNVTLQATFGIGDSDAIETQIDTLTATNTASGQIQITELSAGGSLALNVIDNASRDVGLTVESGALTDGNDGTPDTLNITAGNLTLASTTGIGSGDALETQITSLAASTSGNIQVTELAAGGDLTLNAISAGSGLVDLRALGGALTDGNGATENISAGSIRLDADTGIGAADEIETAGTGLLLTAQTRTGNLQIVNTGELIVDTVGGLAGVQITSNAAASNLSLRARSPLTINSDVINNSGGNIILTAGGSAATDDLTISADVIATGGSGAILLSAGSDVIQTTGTISAAGAGAITLTAGVGTLDGVIRQEDGVRLQSVSGMIDLMADEDIRLSNLQTGHSGANSVTVTSSAGAIIDNGETDVDIIANSGTVTLNAAVGIGHGNALETTVARLAATNSGSGNIQMVETDGIQLSAVQQ
ncbi:MAG: Hemolysin, partial [Planctomycetota bacterium]